MTCFPSTRFTSAPSRLFLLVGAALIVALLVSPMAHAQTSQKLTLDGQFDYASAMDSPSLSVSGQAFTLETWVKHDGNSDPDALIIDKTDGSATSGGYELGLDRSGEEVRAFFDLPGTFNRFRSNTGIPADRWTHIAVTYDGNQISLYLNGELDASTSAGGDIGDNSLPLTIGTKTSAANEKFFSGAVDDVRIWNTVRSALQIKENRFSPLTGSENGLGAYYPFDQESVSADASGNGNTLTLQGDASGDGPDAFPVPPDLYVQNEGNGRVSLQWVERTGLNGENAASSFALHRSPPTGLSGRSQIASPGGSATTYTAASLSNGKTYFWEITALDSEGNESDYSPLVTGTPHDGNEPSPMKGGAALALDGDLDYALLSDRPSLDIFDNTMTIEVWIKHDGTSDPGALIVDKTDGSASTGGYEIGLDGSGEEVRAFVDIPHTFNRLASNAGIPADRWTHLAVSYDGNQISLYLNGELDASTSAGGSVNGNGLPLTIGTRTSAANEKFVSGRIDELRLWSDARTQAEIQANYQQEVVGSEDSLRAYWRFNDAGKGTRQGSSFGYAVNKANAALKGDATLDGPGVFPLPPRTYAQASTAQANLTWSERTPGEANQFSVYRATSPDGSGRTSLTTQAASNTAYTDTGPSNATNTFYEVTATNAGGQESDYAHPVPVTPSVRPFGNALTLDGSNDYGTVSDRPSLDVFDNTMSLEAWVKHDGTSNTDALIVDKTDGASTTGGYQIRLSGSGQKVPVYVDLPATRSDLTSSTLLPAGRWMHVALTYDGNQVSLYVNGLLEGQTGTGGGSVGGNGLPLKMGTLTSASNGQFFSGQIDDVRLWNDARTASEILQSYRTELTGDEQGLAAYWRFNETPGTAVSRAAAERPKTVTLSGDADFSGSTVEPSAVFSSKNVSSDGTTDFGSTGTEVDFSGTGGSGDVTVEKFGSSPTVPDGISEQNVSIYRFLLRAGGDLSFDADTKVRFAVDQLSGIQTPGEVVVYKRDEAGSGDFTPLSTRIVGSSPKQLEITTGSFSEFVFASDTNPLPVELARFDATLDDGTVRLAWQTASETGNARFEVQREHGTTDWSTVGRVAGSGTTTEAQSYRFTDEDLPYAADRLTYRLKQVDTDGTTSFSDDVVVERGAVSALQLLGTYPNPARATATVRYAVPEGGEGDVRLRLYDVLGRQVRTVSTDAKAGRHKHQLNTSELSSGVYFLRLQAGGAVKTQRLTVVR